MPNQEPIAIAGAGIAGLTAALSLARKGFSVDIIERSSTLTAVGAGLQLSPNATRILQTLGVLPALEAVWSEPSEIRLLDGSSLSMLTAVPAGPFARQRWGAPYGVLHRATLQKILLDAVLAQPLCRLHLGSPLTSVSPASVAAITGSLSGLLIGADGVRSRVRAALPDGGSARFSGHLARRLMIPAARAMGILHPGVVSAFVAPGAHLVAYPIRETEQVNLVAITKGRDGEEQDPAQFRAVFSGWNQKLVALLEQAEPSGLWPLYEVQDAPWHDGKATVLIGDAAHAMMPFSAQGAVMAIEDGFELASFLADAPTVPAAIAAFAAHRQPRIARVRARGAFNRFAYHAKGPARLARNLVFRLRRPEALAADLDWLYGYRCRD